MPLSTKLNEQFNSQFKIYKTCIKMFNLVVAVVDAVTGKASECVGKTHYDSRCDWLLPSQQSMPALKMLTEGAWTISLGKAFHKFLL